VGYLAGKDLQAMTIKAHEFDHLVSKLKLKTRDSGDLLAWFEYEGKIIARTKRSKGSGDLPMQHSIRQQLKLNEEQFRKAIGCTLTRQDYINILRSKGLL
jgi:hypothetical protein